MNELYKIVHASEITVHAGSTCLPIKNQRGKLYVNYKGKQVNVKDIPQIDRSTYPVYFGYVFCGLFRNGANYYFDKLLRTK
jgi:hypothetical protein